MESSKLRQGNRHYVHGSDDHQGSRRHDGSGEHRVRFGATAESSESSTSALSHLLGFLTGMVSFVCVCGLLTLLFMLYFTVRPFSVSAYRRLSAQLGLACILDAMVLLLPSSKIYLTGESDVPSPVGTSILVSNHIFDADWWVLFMLGRSVGLQGTMKAFLRNEYLHVNVEKVEDEQSSTSSSSVVASSSSPRIVPISRPENGSVGQRINYTTRRQASPDLSLTARLLHLLLDFPLVNGEGEDYIADRENPFRLLRSFAPPGGTGAPVHFLSFPEGWCLHSGVNRPAILAKSNEFAQKEQRPQLKHLLLPRTRGFNASLECLRESNPVVYDVTMVRVYHDHLRSTARCYVYMKSSYINFLQAYAGYDGSVPPSEPLSLSTLWDILRRKLPSKVFVRVKRFSLEEVLQDSSWLDKTWQEKDRLLSHFARHGAFPVDSRGYRRHQVFDTWSHSLENSCTALARLLLLPCIVPILFLLSIPIFWTLLCIWFLSSIMQRIFPGYELATLSGDKHESSDGNLQSQTPGSAGSTRTPHMPGTPFTSPNPFY